MTAMNERSAYIITIEGIAGVLEDILYCPDVSSKLLSRSKMHMASITE